jgi:lipoprotein-anchoring transpeptidase ErfK/SrfK
MKRPVLAALVCLGLLVGSVSQSIAASLVARIDIASQTMTVSKYGKVVHVWKVSTARKGYFTPRGSWRPTRLHRMWRSRKYDDAPMPYSVFYSGGYAIHGTNAVRRLGRPASHGCVRLATANARHFYALVKKFGPGNTRIIVTN